MLDYSKLKGRIVEIFGSQKYLAAKANLSERSLSLKLNNERYFTQPEIILIAELLNIPYENINDYFFCIKSSNN